MHQTEKRSTIRTRPGFLMVVFMSIPSPGSIFTSGDMGAKVRVRVTVRVSVRSAG